MNFLKNNKLQGKDYKWEEESLYKKLADCNDLRYERIEVF